MKKITVLLTMFVCWLGMAQPTTNAPTPTQGATEVFAIYNSSGTYTNVSPVDYNPNWGQTGLGTNDTAYTNGGTINPVLHYNNFNYQGIDFNQTPTSGITPYNVGTMEYVHVDIFSNTLTSIRLVPIDQGVAEVGQTISITPGVWNSVDLPISGFTGYTFTGLYQFKFDTPMPGTGNDFYVDNIYLWKNPVAAGSDANLSDLQVDGTTLTGFSGAILTYDYDLPSGTTTVPQITSVTTTDSNATYVITQATALPGDATVVVTSQNTTVTKTYTVSFAVAGPNSAAPTPPARNSWDVISLFSDAYSNITIDTWSAVWDDSNVEDVTLFGDNMKKIDFTNFLGVDFSTAGNHQDMSEMTHFHMDFWTDETNVVGKVLNSKFSQWGGTSAEVTSFILDVNDGTTPAVVGGQWVSIDVPFTQFSDAPQTRDDIAQFLLTSNLDIVYVDNIYVYRAATMGTASFENGNNLKVYPNPLNAGETISFTQTINSVEIYTINGQLVRTSNAQNVSSEGLSIGMYLVKVTTEEGTTSSQKLIIK